MRLKPDKEKIAAVLAYIDFKATELTNKMFLNKTVYHIMFYADVVHIARHKQPLCFDNYIRTSFGPEPEYARTIIHDNNDYDLGKLNSQERATLDIAIVSFIYFGDFYRFVQSFTGYQNDEITLEAMYISLKDNPELYPTLEAVSNKNKEA